MSVRVQTMNLKQRQLVARKDADKMREKLQKMEADRLAAVAKAKRDAELDALAAIEELMRDRMALEKEKRTKPYFVIDKFNRQVPPEQEPVYFGEFKSNKDAWLPHGSGQLLLNDKVHIDGTYMDGMLWGQGKYIERNGSTWEGGFYDGHMHGIGYYTEFDVERYPPPTEGSVITHSAPPTDRADMILTNGGRLNTAGCRLEALMAKGELVCYLQELQVGVQVELYDRALGVPLGARATIIKPIKKWKFRCRMQDELNPRERQIDFATTKKFRLLRELKMAYDISAFSFGDNNGTMIKMDETRPYNYVQDTYKLPAIRQAASFAPSLSRFSSLANSSADEESIIGSASNIGTLSRSSSRYTTKAPSKEEVLENEKAVRAKKFLDESQAVGPKLGIAGSRPTAEMRFLHTMPLNSNERKKSDYRESMFEALALGIGKTLQEDMDEEELAKKKAEWAAILARRRDEERVKKQQLVQEQQAVALAEASKKHAEKLRLRQEEESAAQELIEAEHMAWERKRAEEEAKVQSRDEERAKAKLKSR